jgi:hypothetical protein
MRGHRSGLGSGEDGIEPGWLREVTKSDGCGAVSVSQLDMLAIA